MDLWLNASFIDKFIELLLYWHWANNCSVSAGKMTLQFRWLIPVYRQTFWLISLAIYLFIALYVDILPSRATERALKALDFFYFSAAYCDVNADKWNWLPLDRRTSLFQPFKDSCFLVIHLMYFYLFKYPSTRTACLHKYPLTDQRRHIWKVIWWKFLQWQANCPRLANVRTPIVRARQLGINQNTVSWSCQTAAVCVGKDFRHGCEMKLNKLMQMCGRQRGHAVKRFLLVIRSRRRIAETPVSFRHDRIVNIKMLSWIGWIEFLSSFVSLI